MKRTKIVATIGPASENKEILREMIKSGMDVARLNFSHGNYASHTKIIENIRELSQEMEENIGIMADLQGPRIRTLADADFEIKSGDDVLIYAASKDSKISNSQFLISNQIPNSNEENLKAFALDYPDIIQDIEIGNEILIEDGLIRVKVVEKNSDFLKAEAIDGGIIKNHKGVNIPDAKLKIPVITPKDEEDLLFALGQDVDFVAISFVSSAQDIVDLRNKIKKILGREDNLPHIVAKIERREAIKNLDEIIKETDAVMVARGDLGIEIDESKVVILQKEIIAKSRQNIKPVIVATQMLDSMIKNPRPTRAEVSDVSNAVIDHTDAVMLSGETASGKYPVETIKIMTEIIKNTEGSSFDDICECETVENNKQNKHLPFISSVCEMSKSPEAKAILVKSLSGFTARLMSHFRPEKPILVATSSRKTATQLSLAWGVRAIFFETESQFNEPLKILIEKGKELKMLKSGDKAVVIIGKNKDNGEMELVGLKEIA
ncbi:MAG: pyruvate kinase [bacterium]|nr:pyruvate kinase [bacterium]